MAQGKKLETPDDQGVWITNGTDHGKPVRYRIRPVPYEVDRKIYRQVYRDKNARKLGRESAATTVERMREFTLLRATYALVDTENFSMEIGDEGSAAQYGKLLGHEVKVGAEVLLDGKWTDVLRADVLAVLRNHGTWISNRADRLTEAEMADEEEEGEVF